MIAMWMWMACGPQLPRGVAPAVDAARPPDMVVQADLSQPDIWLQAVIQGGSSYDNIGQEGVGLLAARVMVRGGAGMRTPDDVSALLFRTGNEVEVIPGKDQITLRLRCHREQALPCAELFGDMLAAPRWDAATVARLRDEAIFEVQEGLLADEEALADRVLDAWIFEGTPYGHPAEGRYGVLGQLGEPELRRWWSTHVTRRGTLVGVGGAVTPEVVDALQARLALSPATLPDRPIFKPVPSTGRSLLFVETGSDVVGFRLGHPISVTRDHVDYPALMLGLAALGQHRQSFGVLFQSLRGDRGLNYGTYAYAEPFLERSDAAFQEQGVVRTMPYMHLWVRPVSLENAAFALKLTLFELEKAATVGLDPARIEDTRAWLIGALPLMAPDAGRRLAYTLEAQAAGLPDPQVELADALRALTAEDVNAALRQHLRPAEVRVVAVGGAPAALRAALVSDGPTPITYQGVTPDAAQAAVDAQVAALRIGLKSFDVVPAAEVFR